MTMVQRPGGRGRDPPAGQDAVDLVAAQVGQPRRMRHPRVEVSSEYYPRVAGPGEDVAGSRRRVELRALLGPDLRVEVGDPRVAQAHAVHHAALGVGSQDGEAVVRAAVLAADQD